MAEKQTEPREFRATYPWEHWADGNQWRAIQGTDFTVSPASFAAAGRRWCERNNCTWRSAIDPGTEKFPNPAVVFTITRGR
jgi:hypothetical protein